MSNKENLKPIRTKNEAREKGKHGGIKSGEVRRKRKALREELILLLETNNYNQKISLAIIKEAEAGNVKAFEVIRDTIGETVKENIELMREKSFEVNITVKKNL